MFNLKHIAVIFIMLLYTPVYTPDGDTQ